MDAGSSQDAAHLDHTGLPALLFEGNSTMPQEISAIGDMTRQNAAIPGTKPSAGKQKLKRNRNVLSCQPCHSRKQQCDRGKPCKRCIKRGAQDECYYEPPKQRKEPSWSRAGSIEHTGSRSITTHLDTLVQNTLGGLETTALAGLGALFQIVQASNIVVAPTQHLTGQRTSNTLVIDHAVQAAAAALGQLSQDYANSSPEPAGSGPISEILSHIRGSGNAQAATLGDLRTHFPNHAITTYLLSHFFDKSSLHWVWAIVHRPVFDNCYLAFSSGSHTPTLEFIALLAIVCASSLQFLPEKGEDDAFFSDYAPGRLVLKKRLFDFSRSVLLQGGHTPSLERIQALLLLAIYQDNEGNLIEYYDAAGMAMRMAQSLNMNQDGSGKRDTNAIELEIRRRLWWTLFTLDRFQCFTLRTPYLINEQHCNVVLPLNLDQVELDRPDFQEKPTYQSTDYTFHILQIRWARAIGRMWDSCFAVKTPTFQTVTNFEDEIRRFELDLPASFRSPSMQVALARPYLLFQNQVMSLQIYHTRAILLRPFLFIRPTPNSNAITITQIGDFHRYARSICLTFCKRLLALQQHVQKQVYYPQTRWSSFALRIFDAALMLGIAILIDRDDSQNEELDEWIGLAFNLLNHLGSYNTVAPRAMHHLAVVRKRINPRRSDQDDISPFTNRYNDITTRSLAQPQPSISDLLDLNSDAEQSWKSQEVAVFTASFPGFEALCGDSFSRNLENFLDSCEPS